jgi:hypothetical protein
MSFLQNLQKWWKHRRLRARDVLAVEFDDVGFRVRVLKDLGPEWNQEVRWDNVKRVCWKDGGLMSSDMVFVSRVEPDTVAYIPTEAGGGSEFFGVLCERGLLPEHVWREALGNTSGGLFCCPPHVPKRDVLLP